MGYTQGVMAFKFAWLGAEHLPNAVSLSVPKRVLDRFVFTDSKVELEI